MSEKPIPLLRQDRVNKLFDQLAAEIVPETELKWNTPLNLVIAVVLSAQCTDKMVNKATADLFERCKTTSDYLALGEDQLRHEIRSIGLYKSKAKNVIGLCERMQDVFHDEIPDNRKDLQSLPGVGRKTANVVLNVLFGQPTLAVDTHIFRLGNRLGLVRAKNPDQTEQMLLKRIPEKHLRDAHHYLILHGRYVCKARRPECWRCSVVDFCNYRGKELEQP